MEFPSPQFFKHLIFFPGLPGQVFRVPAIPKTPRNRGSCTTLGLRSGRKTRGGGGGVKRGDEIPYGGDVLSQWAKGWYLGI